MNKYLEIFQCDAESWFELAEIYISEYEYEKAAYCFEELILLNPANFLIHQVKKKLRLTRFNEFIRIINYMKIFLILRRIETFIIMNFSGIIGQDKFGSR